MIRMISERTIRQPVVTACLLSALFLLSRCIEEPLPEGSARIETTFQLQSHSAMQGKLTIREAYLKLDAVEISGNSGSENTVNLSHRVSADEPPYRLAQADSVHVLFTLPYSNYSQLNVRLLLFKDGYDLIFPEDPINEVPPIQHNDSGAGSGDDEDSEEDEDGGNEGDGVEEDDVGDDGDSRNEDDSGDAGEEENNEEGGDKEDSDDEDDTANKGDGGNKEDSEGNGDSGDHSDGGDRDDDSNSKGEKGEKEKDKNKDKGNDKDSDQEKNKDKGKGKGEGKDNDKGKDKGNDKNKNKNKGDGHGHDDDDRKNRDDDKDDDDDDDDRDEGRDDDDDDDDDDGRIGNHAVNLDDFFQNAKPSILLFGVYDNNGKSIEVLLAVTGVEQLTLPAQQNGGFAIQLSSKNSAIVSFDPEYWFEPVSPSDIETATLQEYQGREILFIHRDFNKTLYEKLIPRLEGSARINLASDL